MSELSKIRLNKVVREFNISLERVVEFLSSKGHEIDAYFDCPHYEATQYPDKGSLL